MVGRTFLRRESNPTVGYIFALHPAVIVRLVTLAIAPVGALFPQAMLSLVRPRRDAYAHALALLSASMVAQVVVGWPSMGLIIRGGTLMAIVIITLIELAVGHFLGGPEEDDRKVLAFATVARHPGVATTVASLTPHPLAPVGVLLAAVVGDLAVLPYKLWRKRLRAGSGGAPATVG